MQMNFTKYSADGNDFIVFDNRDGLISPGNDALIRSLCSRRTSIGADGVILIDTDREDFSASFFNSDGLPASMCGNGARVAVHFAHDLGIVTNELRFWVNDTIHQAVINDNDIIGVEIFLNSHGISKKTVSYQDKTLEGYYCDTGVPHIVFLNSTIIESEYAEFARFVRNLPDYREHGVNVDIVETLGANDIRITTYERGVEDFTLSCGTGAVAAAWVGVEYGLVKLPLVVRSKGGSIEIRKEENPNSLWIWGSVVAVYSGEIMDVQKLYVAENG